MTVDVRKGERHPGTGMNRPQDWILSIEGISKSFGGHLALHPTDLAIGAGEFVTLLGPSGCGKTTLLRIVAGLEAPSAGRLLTQGRDVTAERPERRPFNMVFQSYALFPHLNVFENVAYGLRASGLDDRTIERNVHAALELVGLAAYRSRSVDQLSGGMSQRVALVRAIVNEPRVLLLDEPLAALDLQLRKRMQLELRAIQKRLGTTFILVTHDQEEALVMSDRIVVMQAGKVMQVGRPQDIYHRPASRFIADFIGETSLVPCTVETSSGAEVQVTLANSRRAHVTSHHENVPAGARGYVSVRPEELLLRPASDALFRGRVSDAVFTGPATRLSVLVGPDIELRVHASGKEDFFPGHEVGIDIVKGAGVFVGYDQGSSAE